MSPTKTTETAATAFHSCRVSSFKSVKEYPNRRGGEDMFLERLGHYQYGENRLYPPLYNVAIAPTPYAAAAAGARAA